jgi:pyruvate, water dikinase
MALLDLTRIISEWRKKKRPFSIQELFRKFQELLNNNGRALELIADMGEKMSGDYLFDKHYIESVVMELEDVIYRIVYDLNVITHKQYLELFDALEESKKEIHEELNSRFTVPKGDYIYPLDSLHKELSDYAGEKMATLGELKNKLGLSVPKGFVISTYAYKRFVEYNRLQEWIDSILNIEATVDRETVAQKIHDLNRRILQAEIPPDLEKVIRKALGKFNRKDSAETRWSVRSSALGEDSQLSYAGQYLTVLNVASSEVSTAYKKVVASLFSQQAIGYRKNSRIQQKEPAMAVGCARMLDPGTSGVIYSTNPNQMDQEQMVISACWGMGKLVVEGEGKSDRYIVSKKSPYSVISQYIGKKDLYYGLGDKEGVALKTVSPELQDKPCLDSAALSLLVQTALRIEYYMKSFQDIEWAMDREGQLTILQARPLQVRWDLSYDKSRTKEAVKNYPVLMKDMGVVASRGIGTGKVFIVETEEDAERFPQGSVLVLRHTSPNMSRLIPFANAVVTDIGSVAGHMATISREFRVPTIVDTQQATKILPVGQEVTVDAEENVIYQGIIKELVTAHLIEKTPYEESHEFRLLSRLLKKISTLHLIDPQSGDFVAGHCRSYHDIIRFAHEMAVRRIAEGISPRQLDKASASKRLKLPVPLDLIIVDIGGGLKEGTLGQIIHPDDLQCEPLCHIVDVLVAPGVWQSHPIALDIKGFMSSFIGNPGGTPFSSDSFKGNLAIVSKEYLNLSLRLGYHFNMIDVTLTDDAERNYIYFRFFGGVTDITRRSRRAKFLSQIMSKNDFAVESKGDLIIARIKKITREIMKEKLCLIGRLIGFTRQLDVLLRTDGDVGFFEEQFFKNEDFITTSPSI